MAIEQVANEFTTTLDGDITSGALSLVLASTSGTGINPCPTAPFRLRIDDELILVGARSGTSCTSLTRGVEATVAVDHVNGSEVRQVFTVAGVANSVTHPTAIGVNALPETGTIHVFESGAVASITGSADALQLIALANDATVYPFGILNTTYGSSMSSAFVIYQSDAGVSTLKQNDATIDLGPDNIGLHAAGNGDLTLQLQGSGEIRLDNVGNTFELVMSDASGASLLGGAGVTIATLPGAHDITINAGRNFTVTAGGTVTIPSFTAAASLDVGAAGVRLAGANGAITFLGLGNGTDEDLTINLNAANVATFSSSTGVTSAAWSGIALDSTLSIKSSGASAGVGYATGAGGASTQSTNKSTTVVAAPNPSVCGSITMDAAALNAGVIVSFTFTNSAIAATDVLVLNHISGGTIGSYTLNAQCGAGSAVINVRNATAGNLSEAVVIQYALVRGVNA